MGLMTAAKTDAITGPSRKHARGYFLRLGLVRLMDYAILIAVGAVSSVPMVWMISTSLKETGREFTFPPQVIPDPLVWLNYRDVWSVTHMHQFGFNSILVAVFATLGTVLTCSLVAFGFARIEFPAKNALFFLLVSTLMLPGIITLVPTFVLFRQMGPDQQSARPHRTVVVRRRRVRRGVLRVPDATVHAATAARARRGGARRWGIVLPHLLEHHPAAVGPRAGDLGHLFDTASLE